MHSIQKKTKWKKKEKPKSQPVIYYLKIIHKIFPLFEGISNELLVCFFFFFPFLLFFSFMKMMIHTSALWRVGQWLPLRQPTSPAHVGKKP